MSNITDTLAEVHTELARAQSLYAPFNSGHEGWAVIQEEMDELFDALRERAPKYMQRKEAIQVAAMAIRYVIDLEGMRVS